jgi:hypothetical protein
MNYQNECERIYYQTELFCEHCGKDLLTDPASGIFVTCTAKQKL